jgi:S1-C subfamily serine protease
VPDARQRRTLGEPGDVIQTVNGRPVDTSTSFVSTIGAMKPGDKVTLRVWQHGVKRNVQVALGEQPADLYLQQQQEQQNP